MAFCLFEELDVWKRASRLAVWIYQELGNCRDYGLKDQMTQAAVSIAERIGILNREQSGPLLADLRELSAILQGLIKSLKKSPNPEN